MPAIVVLGILFGVSALLGILLVVFVSVIVEGPSRNVDNLSQERARELFRQVAGRRVNPADDASPTIGEVVRRGHLEDLLEKTPRSTVS